MNRLAYLGLFALFPGYVIYHYSVSEGWIPPFAGGFFGGASVVFALAGIWHLAGGFWAVPGSTPSLERAFLFLCLFVCAWGAGSFLLLPRESWVSASVRQSLETVAIWVAVYFVGARQRTRWSGTPWMMPLALAAIGTLFIRAMVVHGVFEGPYLTFIPIDIDDAGPPISSYQGIGRALMVTGIVAAAQMRTRSKGWLILALTIVALLSLGSRAHLFGMILVVAGTVGLLGIRRGSRARAVGPIIFFAVVAFPLVNLFMETRASEILDLSESTSWQARLEAQREAIAVVAENPILGSFGYHNRDSVTYAHNILSAWSEFGLGVFVLYGGLILYALVVSARRLLRLGEGNTLWLTAFQLNFAALILAVSTEPVFSSVFPALGWGFTVSALREDRRERADQKGRRRAESAGGRAVAVVSLENPSRS